MVAVAPSICLLPERFLFAAGSPYTCDLNGDILGVALICSITMVEIVVT